MVTVWGHPDPTTSKRAPKYMNGISWKTCVDSCFKDVNCLLAYGNSSEYCGMYSFGDVSKVDNLETVALDKVSFRVTSAPDTCEPVPQMISASNPISTSSEYSSYQILQVPSAFNIEFTKTIETTTNPVSERRCENDMFMLTGNRRTGCYSIYLEAVDYTTAKKRCVSMDGALMIIPSSKDWSWIRTSMEMVFRKWLDSQCTVHFGIELTDSNTWSWTLPELIEDDSGYIWAKNEPNPENKCAWIQGQPFPGVPQLVTHSCSDLATGYCCYFANMTM